jgi:alginate O-acetyltransferase complex protein AlgI
MSNGFRKRKLLLVVTLIWLIGNLCFFKYLAPLSSNIFSGWFRFRLLPDTVSAGILFPLGLSYITFRLIHYIVEVYRKNTPRGSFPDFALYILFFPTFLAGPVERFQRFYPQIKEVRRADISNINYGLFRIMCGLVRKIIIADNLKNIIMPVLISPSVYGRTVVVCAVYGLAVQLYMDFAGYTDIAIGAARLFGYKIMENFNRPFFQKNIALFWRNWHISVSSWIRDYFFFPFFGYRASNIKIYIGVVCSMVVFMLWHKASLSFLILGIYYGVGLAAWFFFQEVKRRYPVIATWTAKKYLDPISIFVTFSFVSFSTVFLRMDFAGSVMIIQRIAKG